MVNLIIVCTGNTCRSPMAEAMLRQKVVQSGFKDKIKVSSAGIAAGGAFPASHNAYSVMKARGLDLVDHRSRQLTAGDIKEADLILTMTSSHKKAILSYMPKAKNKVFTLAEYAGLADEVVDPFGGDVRIYSICADQIAGLVENVWEKIVALAGNKT